MPAFTPVGDRSRMVLGEWKWAPRGVSNRSVERADESVLRDPVHRTAMVALAAVLALDAADRTALGALAPALKAEFGIGNAAVGLLASAFAVVGALAIVPVGI